MDYGASEAEEEITPAKCRITSHMVSATVRLYLRHRDRVTLKLSVIRSFQAIQYSK